MRKMINKFNSPSIFSILMSKKQFFPLKLKIYEFIDLFVHLEELEVVKYLLSYHSGPYCPQITFSSAVPLDERIVYKSLPPTPEHPTERTAFRQESIVTVHNIPFAGSLENIILSSMRFNSNKVIYLSYKMSNDELPKLFYF